VTNEHLKENGKPDDRAWIIERLINEELVTKGIEVTVYDFTG